MRWNSKRLVFLVIALGIIVVAFIWLHSWKEERLRYGLVYHHPFGNYTEISKIHWLGSPSQFDKVYSKVEQDLADIAAAGYRNILFHTAIACLDPYPPYFYPTDFDCDFLKQEVRWIADKAESFGLEVYVLYYPDWRCPPYNESFQGDYYDEDSENWNLMINFTNFLVTECDSVRWAAPYCLTDNMTRVQHFFDHLPPSPKIMIHADQSFVNNVVSSLPRNRPKLLEVYDEPYISIVKDIGEHIITGQSRNVSGSNRVNTLTQEQQIQSIRQKIGMLGSQQNIIIWCYADYPDSSYPEGPGWGLVQASDEPLPSVEVWDEYTVLTYRVVLALLVVAAVLAILLSIRKRQEADNTPSSCDEHRIWSRWLVSQGRQRRGGLTNSHRTRAIASEPLFLAE